MPVSRCEWSSDVCSADLDVILQPAAEILGAGDDRAAGALLGDGTRVLAPWVVLAAGWNSGSVAGLPAEIGRAACRERAEISLVAVSLNKQQDLMEIS